MTTFKKNQTTYPLMFHMVLAADHVTPATGLSPTVTISKNGAAFAAPAGAVAEVGAGWYKVVPNAADFNTLGPLVVHATAVTADPTDSVNEVNTGLVDLSATQMTDIVGNVQGSVGSVVSPVTCKSKCKCC